VRPRRVGIIDLVTKGPTKALYARVMNANLASIMPQVIGVWCEEDGHQVSFTCYTGFEDLIDELPSDLDVVFIGAFTQAAQLAYALSNLYRSRGAVTVLGGPHARCYPEDARRYFDYVLGFTDREQIRDILRDPEAHRPLGVHLEAAQQPRSLPGVRQRWPYIERTLAKAPIIQIVPMLGSLGCPYTCSFCIDSEIPYQPLDFEMLKDDLRFQGAPAGNRVMVRPREQVEDGQSRGYAEGPGRRRARADDPASHSLRANKLRVGARQ
jgi:hypothetical protein